MAGDFDALISHLEVPDGKYRVLWLSDSEPFVSSFADRSFKRTIILCLVSRVSLSRGCSPRCVWKSLSRFKVGFMLRGTL